MLPRTLTSAPASRTDPAKLAVIAAAVAGGGYIAYRYWYLPAKMREDLNLAMLQSGARPGSNALQALGAGVCSAYGAKYGIPPQASYGICGEVASAAQQLVQQLPQLLAGTGYGLGQGLNYVGQGLGGGLQSLGQGLGGGVQGLGSGLGGAVQGIGSGVAGAGVALTDAGIYAGTAPLKIGGAYVGGVYGAGKTVVKDVYGGVKTVLSDAKKLLPWNW